MLRHSGGAEMWGEKKWSGRLDLNQRPHAPQACALPGCATSRLSFVARVFRRGGLYADGEKTLASKEASYKIVIPGSAIDRDIPAG